MLSAGTAICKLPLTSVARLPNDGANRKVAEISRAWSRTPQKNYLETAFPNDSVWPEIRCLGSSLTDVDVSVAAGSLASQQRIALSNFFGDKVRTWKTGEGTTMRKWGFVILAMVIAAGLVAWYAFRPERLLVSQTVNEAFPEGQAGSAQTLASGTFHSVLHPTEGTATIYRFRDGSRVLRLTNFKTSNGPDVHVYMVAADDAKDHATVLRAGFIDLGVIKGNIGDQNYTLGSDVDLSKYRTVSVWCKRFSVNFGAAPLTPDHTMSQK